LRKRPKSALNGWVAKVRLDPIRVKNRLFDPFRIDTPLRNLIRAWTVRVIGFGISSFSPRDKL
jgi:hypothetical protein